MADYRPNKFSEWTTQAAFALTLTKVGIGTLLAMKHQQEREGDEHKGYIMLQRMQAGYLLRRGLIQDTPIEGYYVRTRPGVLMTELLIEAGFTYGKFNIDPEARSVLVDKGGVYNVMPIEPCDIPTPEIKLKSRKEMEESGAPTGW